MMVTETHILGPKFRLRHDARRLPVGVLRAGSATSWRTSACGTWLISSLLPGLRRADARVDEPVEDLDEIVGHQDRDRDDERHALDHGVVVRRDRTEEQIPHSGVAEHE